MGHSLGNVSTQHDPQDERGITHAQVPARANSMRNAVMQAAAGMQMACSDKCLAAAQNGEQGLDAQKTMHAVPATAYVHGASTHAAKHECVQLSAGVCS